jgi:predicted RNA-binding protein YlxR (DUF448 family)
VSAQPERTCIGCGLKARQTALVRLVRVEGQVAVDRMRRGGRGAWLHPEEACLEKAVRRKAFGRAFRGPAAVDPGALRGQLTGNARRD